MHDFDPQSCHRALINAQLLYIHLIAPAGDHNQYQFSHLKLFYISFLCRGCELKFISYALLGLLSAVGSFAMTVQDSTISLTWTAPSTLDIPSENPDIRGYCVDIFNSSSYTLVHSECGINDTLFNYPTPDDGVCHIYMFTVTPVNVVGNGTKNTISYFGVESRT